MPSFHPETEYVITSEAIRLEEFHKYSEEFVTRPPYQRKNVWSRKKQQALLDSLFRGYYIPRIVIRQVRLSDEETVKEVIDGQQRITTAQRFLAGNLPLPRSLRDLRSDLPGKTYDELPSEVRRFVDRLSYDADIVLQIDNPYDPHHQHIATEIFWRLQQGESLNYMEVAHARLSSTARNFVVKYADDQTFDYDTYSPVDENPAKHPFFSIIRRKNNRMQHMALLTRLLILEEADGSADIKQTDVKSYIDRYQSEEGVGSDAFESSDVAQHTLANLNTFHEVFEDDPLRADGEGVPILKVEYFIISLYLLLRHVKRHYVFGDTEKMLFRDFAYDFYDRWRNSDEDDVDIQVFQNKRQQSASEISARHRIMRQLLFEYADENGHEIRTKDDRRRFSEAKRIRIYRRDEGLCQQCLAEGKPPKEAKVPWEEYEADHIVPHSKGGKTVTDNAQVLCRYHNRQKGAQPASDPDAPSSAAAEPPAEYRPAQAERKSGNTRFWLSPVGTRGDLAPLDVVRRTVGRGRFGFSRDAIQQMRLRPGDRLVFYASGEGIVAEAEVAERPFYSDDPEEELRVPDADGFPFIVALDDVTLYETPVEITQDLRQDLDAFEGKDPTAQWGWFVVTVREVTQADYQTLTR